MRTAIKKVRAAIAAKNAEDAKGLLASAVTLIDRAGGRSTIPRNTAARLVSRLTRAVHTI